jgi:hypothetical protein
LKVSSNQGIRAAAPVEPQGLSRAGGEHLFPNVSHFADDRAHGGFRTLTATHATLLGLAAVLLVGAVF